MCKHDSHTLSIVKMYWYHVVHGTISFTVRDNYHYLTSVLSMFLSCIGQVLTFGFVVADPSEEAYVHLDIHLHPAPPSSAATSNFDITHILT